MNTDVLIIGQGISGSFLTWYLHKAGIDFIVIDSGDPASSSRVAAGIINPVTGRRIVKTWMIDTLMPFAVKAYTSFGEALGIQAITERDIISFFPSPQSLLEFRERIAEESDYISIASTPGTFSKYFNYDFGYGAISPSYSVNLAEILPAWRNTLGHHLRDEVFDPSRLRIKEEGISYDDISADKIIFCDGVNCFNNAWFKNLPFAQNKGQALIIRSAGIPDRHIYKKGLTIVPLKDDFYWIGSSYEWNFNDALPSEDFRKKTETQLKHWLRSPFTVEAHLSSLRPATLERRPFAGFHPVYQQIGILNGMGTKGCSLAPFFANQVVNNITHNEPIWPEANVERFRRILSSEPRI